MKMPDNEVLLSFILPVYNVEAYLQECIDSILQQITPQCEIILVDDGSTDSSGEICESYARSNPQIHLVKKENGGLSSARNAGIPVARGRYITFIDSDDKIFPNAVAEILRWIQAEKMDLCFLQAVKLYPDGTQESMGEGIVRDGLRGQKREDAVKHLASRPKYPGSAWAKLYRREFLLENDLHFPYDRRYSEDLGFMRDCILRAKSMDVLDIPYYLYRQNRKGSITNRITSQNFNGLLCFIIESVEKLTVNKKPKDTASRYAMGFAAYEYGVLLLLYHQIPDGDKKAALAKLKKYKWILRYANNRKGHAISFCCGLLGIRLTSILVYQYRKRA